MNPKKSWNTRRYSEKNGSYEFALRGQMVQELRFGGGVRLVLRDDFSTIISLQADFAWIQHGQTQQLKGSEVVSLAPLLQLAGSEIERAISDKSGFLTLRFANKTQIQVPNESAGFAFEAWEISDGHGFLAVCAIGGRVSIWEPDSPEIQILRTLT